MLYQLSYSRERWDNLTEPTPDFYRASTMLTAPACRRLPRRPARVRHRPRTGPGTSGGEGDRTPDLVNAIHALSQLSYVPGPKSLCRKHIHPFPAGTAKPI